MSKALLLGAGLVARPLAHYLLDNGIELTIADRYKNKATRLLNGHPRGTAIAWTANDNAELKKLISAHDVVISLLPAKMHPIVAEACIECHKHMVTTSYISPQMQVLDPLAKAADVVLINELGVDPGIDHMSAMRVIDHVRNSGGKIASLRSYCGGLPAPDANNNPWGYKFSWSPLGVLTAGTNSARYLKNGRIKKIAPEYLFLNTHQLEVEGVGTLDVYPNRNSVHYIALYGLQNVTTMFRGTLRYPGWCETLYRLGELGLLNDTENEGLSELSWAEILASLINAKRTTSIKEKIAAHLWLPIDSPTIQKLEWLGLFSEDKPSTPASSIMERLSLTMQDKMLYAPGERDMIILHHDFIAKYSDRTEHITSTLVDLGIPNGDSAMARTVSLPAAIAAKMVLEGRISERGVCIPLRPTIYNPILDELATMNIVLKEQTTVF